MLLAAHGAELILWIHILAACVWVGGQITIAALIPMLRAQPALLAAAARRYQWLAWIAFALLILTGLANVHNAGIPWNHLTVSPRGRTLLVKLLFVALSGLAAAIHAFIVAPRAAGHSTAPSRALSALLGAVSLLAAIIAALYGVVIAEGQ